MSSKKGTDSKSNLTPFPPPQIGISIGVPSANVTAGTAIHAACPATTGARRQSQRCFMADQSFAWQQEPAAFAFGAAS